ncbi:MAG: NADP-dependent oxidoreductase [Phenylobacterium sp.]|uniref:NADP-dependent oxidoreductase n=1 Tax=Phenylobacterium sp. TaxID=1871053 RepID=UPI001A5F8595|nr:NADP-dependent oxidoreductase [Phenylobacterium sp.]MBL8553680.1 NADP-dependent oxidoreductase [Phenylobacterium sp.]
MTNRQYLLDRLPGGEKLSPGHFALRNGEVPKPGAGEVLLKTRYVSLDAANRAWMQGATYRSALEGGQVMAGGSLSEVVESDVDHLKPGDLVFADIGWQEYGVAPGKRLEKLPDLKPETHLLSVYGIAGLTAYFGLLECGRPQAGDTVVVSAAAGSVGSIVGQIARIKGCRVVGIAGGEEKGRWLTEELGFDAAVDYRSPEFKRQLRAAVPEGIDVFFDNTGGDVFEACLFAMKNHGRIACCGALSQYDGAPPPHGPRGIPGLIVTKRLTLRGFVVMDFAEQNAKALADLQGWVTSGELRVKEDIVDGFENLPQALIGLLGGDNRGKRMVRV